MLFSYKYYNIKFKIAYPFSITYIIYTMHDTRNKNHPNKIILKIY